MAKELESSPGRGGKRKGAGRKKGVRFTEPSKLISVRVPESVYLELKDKYGKLLSEKIRNYLIGLKNSEI